MEMMLLVNIFWLHPQNREMFRIGREEVITLKNINIKLNKYYKNKRNQIQYGSKCSRFYFHVVP